MISTNYQTLLNRPKGQWLEVNNGRLVNAKSKLVFVLSNIFSFGSKLSQLRQTIKMTLEGVAKVPSSQTFEKLSRLSKKICPENLLIPFLGDGQIVHLANVSNLMWLQNRQEGQWLQANSKGKISYVSKRTFLIKNFLTFGYEKRKLNKALKSTFNDIRKSMIKGSIVTSQKIDFMKAVLQLKDHKLYQRYLRELSDDLVFPEALEAKVSENNLTEVFNYDNQITVKEYEIPSAFIVHDRIGRNIGVWKPNTNNRMTREIASSLVSKIVPVTTKMTFSFEAHLSQNMVTFIHKEQREWWSKYGSELHRAESLPSYPYLPYTKKVTMEGAFQRFIVGKEFGQLTADEKKRIPTKQVHILGIDDLKLISTDRNKKNIIVDNEFNIWGIDNEATWSLTKRNENLCWKDLQQTKEPFDAETLAYIESLDTNKERKLLENQGIIFDEAIYKENQRRIEIIKKAAQEGKTLYEIVQLIL